MAFALKATSGEFESAPEGTHGAVCVRLLDLGTQIKTFNNETSERRELMIVWEIDEQRNDGKRFHVSQIYTLSMHKRAKLRQMIEGWRGRTLAEGEQFDIRNLLGKPCLLSISINERGYPVVQSVAALPKGMAAIEAESPLLMLDLDEPDWDAFNELSERLQDKISQSPEYQRGPAAPAPKAWPARGAARAQPPKSPPPEREPGSDDDVGESPEFDDDIPF